MTTRRGLRGSAKLRLSRRDRILLTVNALLFLFVAGGFSRLITIPANRNPDAGPIRSDPPEPDYRLSEDGVRVAHFDMGRLNLWCASRGLPPPPNLVVAEAPVAEALISALRAIVADRNAAAVGLLGQICESLECHDSARQCFLEAGRLDRTDYRWPYYLGCVEQAAGRNDEAVAALLEAAELDATYPVTYARLGQLYLETQRDGQAEESLSRYVELRPSDWLGHVGLGRVALRRGDHQEALRHLNEALRLGPDDFQTHYYLGRVHAELGDETLATKHFDISSRLPRGRWFRTRDPLVQELYRTTASAAALQTEFQLIGDSRDWPRLAVIAEQIIRQRPGDTTMMRNLALLYGKMKRFDEAKAVLDRAVRLEPESATLHVTRGNLWITAGDPTLALLSAKKALALDPRSGRAFGVLGRASFLLKKNDEALIAMRRAVELDPAYVRNVYVLGEILLGMERTVEAEQTYRRVLELDPRNEDARQRLGEILSSKDKS